jgi:chromosome partitioning protein
VLIGTRAPAEALMASASGGFQLLPANRELAGAELDLIELDERERRLALALLPIADQYDQIVIDCPPSLSLITLNGLCAASDVIIPMQCEYYALEGLSDLVNTLRKVKSNFNPCLEILGLLRVMYDPRMALAQQVSAQLEEHFGSRVFTTVIPRNVRLAEAPSHGQPGLIYDRSSRGAQAYLAFGRELLSRIAADRAPVSDRA